MKSQQKNWKKKYYKIKNRESTGHDNITSQIIKVMEETEIQLSLIINRVSKEVKIPYDWKFVVIIPIYEKGNNVEWMNKTIGELHCSAA